MKLSAGTLLIAVIVAIAALSAQAAPKRWYWTQSRAEALVAAKVRIPFCRVVQSDPRCVDGRPAPGQMHLIGAKVISAQCTGATELGSTFKYNRFTCDIITFNDGAEGNIAVYVTGPATFRWKIIG